MKKFILLFLAVAIAASLAGSAQAFDGDRKGFILNLGAGFGQGKLSGPGDSIDGNGISTAFKIGAGLSPQAVLFYTNRVIWWDYEGVSINTGMSAAGFSYFFSPEAPSFFLTGALGVGVIRIEDSDSESGMGFGLGAGYEFTQNWTAELSYLSSGVGEDNWDLSISNLAFTISWFAY